MLWNSLCHVATPFYQTLFQWMARWWPRFPERLYSVSGLLPSTTQFLVGLLRVAVHSSASPLMASWGFHWCTRLRWRGRWTTRALQSLTVYLLVPFPHLFLDFSISLPKNSQLLSCVLVQASPSWVFSSSPTAMTPGDILDEEYWLIQSRASPSSSENTDEVRVLLLKNELNYYVLTYILVRCQLVGPCWSAEYQMTHHHPSKIKQEKGIRPIRERERVTISL